MQKNAPFFSSPHYVIFFLSEQQADVSSYMVIRSLGLTQVKNSESGGTGDEVTSFCCNTQLNWVKYRMKLHIVLFFWGLTCVLRGLPT